MSDLISREELKKTAKRIESMPWSDEEGNRIEFKWASEEVEALIDKAPPASQWIPVTERLPIMGSEVLTTVYNKFRRCEYVKILYYHGEEYGWSDCGIYKVIAWMPLPEPYKGGDAECNQ